MKHLVLSLLFALPFVAQAQCSIEEYQILLKEAKTAQQKGQYDLAINKLFSVGNLTGKGGGHQEEDFGGFRRG